MKIIKSNMLENHEGTEYLYVFHDLVSHKEGTDTKYAISKAYYFQKEEQFYKQHEMLQDDLESIGIKDKSTALDHIGKLNKEQLKLAKAKRSELKSIQNSAPKSNKISDLIEFHDEVIGLLLEWFNKNDIKINDKKKSSGRPKGSKNKKTDQKYNWIRDKYFILKKGKNAHTIEEYARLIRSQLKTKSPDWWGKSIYGLETIVDIIKKQKWGD